MHFEDVVIPTIGLEKWLKNLRCSYKLGQKRPLGDANEQLPPVKRDPKPVMPSTAVLTRDC